MLFVVGLVFTVVPGGLWAMTVRTHRVGWAVGAVLAACAVGKFLVQNDLVAVERGRDDLVGLALLIPVPVIVAGWSLERWTAGPRKVAPLQDRSQAAIAGLIGYTLVAAVVTGLVYHDGGKDNLPSSALVLPLPVGLVSQERGPACDADADRCGVGFRVTSSTGLTVQQIEQRVREHLERSHGWHLDSSGRDCRPSGWVLDRSQTCVRVTVVPGSRQVAVDLLNDSTGGNPTGP
ncbi:hypothetical protein ACIRPK_06380 [Kitasatospora sp. NPDC101801]|uniref:hypothetical protein n=1 Tax=Kitasatospora sp. NPDC101801 TaxID=3364103 RepID=UPI00382AFB5D